MIVAGVGRFQSTNSLAAVDLFNASMAKSFSWMMCEDVYNISAMPIFLQAGSGRANQFGFLCHPFFNRCLIDLDQL